MWSSTKEIQKREQEQVEGGEHLRKPKIWNNAIDANRCPVQLLELLVSKRPPEMCQDDSPVLSVSKQQSNRHLLVQAEANGHQQRWVNSERGTQFHIQCWFSG